MTQILNPRQNILINNFEEKHEILLTKKIRTDHILAMFVHSLVIIFVFLCGIKNAKTKLYKIMTLPVALYGQESLSLISRKEHILKMSENKVLKRMFVRQRIDVTGEWKRTELGSTS